MGFTESSSHIAQLVYTRCTVQVYDLEIEGDCMDKTLAVVGVVFSAITIFAIFYGPIAALKIQRRLDEERETRSRKLQIFKTLMSNRATRVAPLYVQALN